MRKSQRRFASGPAAHCRPEVSLSAPETRKPKQHRSVFNPLHEPPGNHLIVQLATPTLLCDIPGPAAIALTVVLVQTVVSHGLKHSALEGDVVEPPFSRIRYG